MLELGKASSGVYKNFNFKNVPVVKILQWKKLLIYSNFLQLIPHISYDKMKLFVIKILKLIDND